MDMGQFNNCQLLLSSKQMTKTNSTINESPYKDTQSNQVTWLKSLRKLKS